MGFNLFYPIEFLVKTICFGKSLHSSLFLNPGGGGWFESRGLVDIWTMLCLIYDLRSNDVFVNIKVSLLMHKQSSQQMLV